jgi:hypothetical protein
MVNEEQGMTNKEAITYANILNRLYSKDFRAYTRARLNTPSKYEIKKLVKVAKAECEHQAKIRHDALVQELFDLAHHTRLREHVNKKGVRGSCRVGYTTTITPTAAQKRVKRLAQKCAKESSRYTYRLLKQNEVRANEARAPVTQELIQAKFFYDPLTGEITHNEGAYANRSAICLPKSPKPLKAQTEGRLPLRARNNPPTHIGYKACTAREWREENNRRNDTCSKTCSEKTNPILERFYLERNMDKSSANATIKKAYYVKCDTSLRAARVAVNIPSRQTSFMPQAIAYLYMGAGGRFDYITAPNGDITLARRSEEVVQEPYGMKHIDPKTNKPTAYPCRDGDKFNYAWDNIKPHSEAATTSAAQLTRIPTKPRASPKEFTLVQSKRAYSIEACITGTQGDYVVQGIKGKSASWSDWDSALECFHAQIKKLGGTTQRLRNGTVLVTRMVKEYEAREYNNKPPQCLTQGLG